MKAALASSVRFTALSVLVSLAASISVAQEFRAVGSEFQVNSYTQGYQGYEAAGMAANGTFVVVWQNQNNSTPWVTGQRFTAAGVRAGAEFQVNSYTGVSQGIPRMAMNPGGGFVVVWVRSGVSYDGVFARRFDAGGGAQGIEFRVDQGTSADVVAVAGNGPFVVVWDETENPDGDSNGILARRYSSSGVALGSPFQVNTFTPGRQSQAAVASRADGGFDVVWQSNAQDGDVNGVFGRRFDSSGVALAVELQVNSYTIGEQHGPSVAIAGDGRSVVAWTSFLQDGASNGVFAQRFDSAGVAQGAEFQINTHTVSAQQAPQVTIGENGAFLVVWEDFNDGQDRGIFARRFDSLGVGLGGEFQVNTYTAGDQSFPTVGGDAAGGAVVAWVDGSSRDGSSNGVFAQLYRLFAPLDIDGNGSRDPLTDGLLVLRYLFGFRGDVLINGAIGPGCTRCDSAAIEAYLSVLD